LIYCPKIFIGTDSINDCVKSYQSSKLDAATQHEYLSRPRSIAIIPTISFESRSCFRKIAKYGQKNLWKFLTKLIGILWLLLTITFWLYILRFHIYLIQLLIITGRIERFC